jgi:hypothetical protein
MRRISTSLAYSVLAVSTVMGLATQASAGEPYSPNGQAPLPRGAVPVGGHGYYGYHGGHAATFQESVLRGEAEVRRARGEQALNTAEALRSLEAAKDQALDNQVKRLAVRQNRELMARTHRAEMQRLKLAQRAAVREALLQEQAETEAAMSPAEKAEKFERLAAGKLDLARRLKERGHSETAQEWMNEIVEQYPGTAAAREVSLLIAGQ